MGPNRPHQAPRDPRRQTHTHRWLHFLLKKTLGRYFCWYYRIRVSGLDALAKEPSPWLILPNHVTTWDPILISLFLKDPVYFIASDANFRRPMASWWLRQVGAIPTSKLATDMTTVRQMVDLLRQGKTVGLFPEGERTWDGATLPIIPATAKLARLAKVSVVVPVLKGGFFALPRWAYKSRRGPLFIEYKVAISAGEIRSLTLEEIEDRITSAISHDDHIWLRSQPWRYSSPKPAEPLQLTLFCCPHCQSLNTLRGQGSRFGCTESGWQTTYTSRGLFKNHSKNLHYFDTIRQWSLWQDGELTKAVANLGSHAHTTVLFADSGAVYSVGYKFSRLKKKGFGRLSLESRGLTFYWDSENEVVFRFQDIRGVNVVYQSQLEFYYNGELRVFRFPDKQTSGYKYLLALRRIP